MITVLSFVIFSQRSRNYDLVVSLENSYLEDGYNVSRNMRQKIAKEFNDLENMGIDIEELQIDNSIGSYLHKSNTGMLESIWHKTLYHPGDLPPGAKPEAINLKFKLSMMKWPRLWSMDHNLICFYENSTLSEQNESEGLQ